MASFPTWRFLCLVFLVCLAGFLFLAPIPQISNFFGFDASSKSFVERQTFALSLASGTGLATLISAIFAAIFTARAAAAASDQARATKQATIEERRPWIKVDLFFDEEPARTRDGGWEAMIGIHITNVGNSPALDVQTSIETRDFELDLHKITQNFAKENRTINPVHGRPLMPGEEYVRPWGASYMPASEFEPTPVILGCVTYKSPLDQSVHQTAFCFVVDRDTPYGQHVASMTSRFRERKKIELSTYWGAGFAD